MKYVFGMINDIDAKYYTLSPINNHQNEDVIRWKIYNEGQSSVLCHQPNRG